MNPKLKEIIEKTAGATEGPWVAIAPDNDSEYMGVVVRDKRYHDSTRDICIVREPGKWADPRNPADEPSDQPNTVLLASAPTLLALATELDAEVDRLREALQAERDLRLAEIKDHQQKQTTMFKRAVNAERAIRAVEDKVGTTCFCGSDRHIDRCWPCAIREALSTPSLISEESSPWQPIETAPKDGSRILTSNLREDEDPSPITTLWWKPEGPLAEGDWFVPGSGHLVGDLFVMNHAYAYDPPTHWMPLPSAPSLTGEGGGKR